MEPDPQRLAEGASRHAGAGHFACSGQKLQACLAKLNESYATLTADHWAIVRSVDDRRVTDAALAGVTDALRKLVALYPEPPAAPAPSELTALSAEIGEHLTAFATKLDAIILRLAPPAPPAPAAAGWPRTTSR